MLPICPVVMYMSTAAGAEIDAANFDEAQGVMGGFGNLADSHFARLLGRSLVDQDLAIIPDELVGVALRLHQLGGTEVVGFQIDGGGFIAQVKADGGRIEHLEEGSREDVLSGVLLHVILAAVHVDEAAHAEGQRQGRVEMLDNVQNGAVGFVLEDLGNGEFRQRRGLAGFSRDELDPAGIEGLAAAGGIERGAIQQQGVTSVGEFADAGDGGGEVEEKRVLVVEALGHIRNLE